MSKIITIFCLWIFLISASNCANQNHTFIYNRYRYNEIIHLIVNKTTEQVLDFDEDSNAMRGVPTRVHVLSNDSLSQDYPVFITATQQKGILSWELPLVIQNGKEVILFDEMGRTLCPHDAGPDIKSNNRPTISVTTSNPKNVSVDIKLRRVTDFYVELDKEVQLNVTPNTPKYYYFSFNQNSSNFMSPGVSRFKYTIPKAIILIIDSDDDICASVSIQNNSCPVFDNEKQIMYQGEYLTMSTKGGITLTESQFPTGFYIVFVVKESDDECLGVERGRAEGDNSPLLRDTGRVKNFRFRVIETVSHLEYVIGGLVAIAVIVLVAFFVLMAPLCSVNRSESVPLIEEAPIPSSSGPIHVHDGSEDSEEDDIVVEETPTAPIINSERLTVGKLSRATAKTLARRSERYFWNALTVAVVYALPVAQLLFTYQSMVFKTGNQDLCYYNFFCAHPMGFFSDFNHVYSNIGYILLGLVFMAQVRWRQLYRGVRDQDMGIPQNYGLLYSMGLALFMEGLLSACYHLCPNKMNFQFDSSFMYVIAVLVMIKLYQNRHSDIIPSAHSTFMLLALIMTICLIGILHPSVGFSILFTIMHMLTCLVMTLKIYYAGKFKMEVSVCRRAYCALKTHRFRAFVPTQVARAILLALANVANWTLAIYSSYERKTDFARLLLVILMGNAILYTMFYIVMKLVHRERILVHTWVYVVIAHVAWFTALYFFLDSKTKWSQTPSQSRTHNAACSSLNFFDSHDNWHLISASAMYFSFNMLLTIDDALLNTPRDSLPTF